MLGKKRKKKKDKSSFILVGDTCTPLLAESSHSFTPPTTDNSKLKGWDGAETTAKVRWGQGSSWVGTGCCKPNLHKKTLVTKSFGKEYSSPISNYGACCSIHNKKNRSQHRLSSDDKAATPAVGNNNLPFGSLCQENDVKLLHTQKYVTHNNNNNNESQSAAHFTETKSHASKPQNDRDT